MARLPEETVSALARDLAAVLDAHVPGWTTSQPHDPGITILEVMAYVIDVLAYRQMSGRPRSSAQRRSSGGFTRSSRDVMPERPSVSDISKADCSRRLT